MTDVSHLEFLPRLIRRVAQDAPSVHVEVLRIGPDTRRLLESGEADLAVGYMPELEAGFYQQQLFEQGFSCVVRKDHPHVDKRMTLRLFKREKHVAITAPGTGHDLLQQQLKRLGVERRLALSLPTLPGLGNLLAQSDLIATVPERVAQMLVSIAAVKLLAPPFELPAFAIKQHWHERFHLDPANRWLRSMIAEMFLE